MKRLLLVLALLLAGDALAADAWVSLPGATQATVCNFHEQRVCWWEVTEAGSVDVTTVIDASVCENVTGSWFNNTGAATHNNIAAIYDSGGGLAIHASDFTAEKIDELDGNPETDSFSARGFDGVYVYVRFTMNDVGSTGLFKMHCHPRVN